MTWKKVSPGGPQPPLRGPKGYGTVGRPIPLIVNQFEVSCKEESQILTHYDVTVENKGSDRIPKWKKLVVFEKMKECFPLIFKDYPLAYDCEKNAYSVGMIPGLRTRTTYKVTMSFVALSQSRISEGRNVPATAEIVQATEPGKSKKKGKKKAAPQAAVAVVPAPNKTDNPNDYLITLDKVSDASMKELFDALKHRGKQTEIPNAPLQMIEVMFRHYRATKFHQVGRNSFFSLGGEFAAPYDIGGGKDGMTGFFASLRPAAWKNGSLLLNIDKAHAAFYKQQPVLDYIMENHRVYKEDFKNPLSPMLIRQLKKELSKIKVRTTHALIKRTYKVNGVTPEGADRLKFDVTEDGRTRKLSVVQYFKEKYNVVLKYPKLNCLHVGNPQKDVWVPIEVCHIEKGQKVLKKLNDKETANFIRSTAVPPADRLRYIQNAVRTNDFKSDPMLKALSFTIADMPLRTKGRVLPEPSLTMDKKSFNPRDGVWDIRDKKFHLAAKLRIWAVINYDSRTSAPVVNTFFQQLIRIGREKGMDVQPPVDFYEGRKLKPSEDFAHYKQRFPDIDLIACVLPDGDMGKRLYSDIKVAGDRDTGIISQCVAGKNVAKAAAATISNILLKINAKLDGTNNIVGRGPSDLINFNEPFMIMGADVNHPPSKGDQSMPSIAAVVGTCDPHATKFTTETRAQTHRMEIIEDMQEITRNCLKNFHRKTKTKPSRIIMYRDGVSESQFPEVLAKEMLKMREACTSLSPDYKPGITFICVQKRHHTRFFCENDHRDGVGRCKNVPPGTVVDRDVTHPYETDFYLCSHQGIQGTSRPAHYHVLWDDNDLPMDELQALTYKLCHVYSRCTRSVSIPVSAYYAHLAAFRAKVYVGDAFDDDSKSVTSGASSDDVASRQKIKSLTRVDKDQPISSRLFYV